MRYFFLFIILCFPLFARADSISNRLSGRILLQVEENGEAWYVNPTDAKRYFLNRPKDAFEIMRKFGEGITDNDLEKIPIGLLDAYLPENDSDGDGLGDELEDSIGTDKNSEDTDADGYNDFLEVKNGYSPVGSSNVSINIDFASRNKGRILIQVEKNGEAWYVDSNDNKRYYLGRPSDAFAVMRGLGLGITNQDIAKISQGENSSDIDTVLTEEDQEPEAETINKKTAEQVLEAAGLAIISGDTEEALKYFTPRMEIPVTFTIENLDKETRFALGNFIAGASLSSSDEDGKIYVNHIYFSGERMDINFNLLKTIQGDWLLDNI